MNINNENNIIGSLYINIYEKNYIKEKHIFKFEHNVLYLKNTNFIGCIVIINNKQYILTNSYTIGSSFNLNQYNNTNTIFNKYQNYYYILIPIYENIYDGFK